MTKSKRPVTVSNQQILTCSTMSKVKEVRTQDLVHVSNISGIRFGPSMGDRQSSECPFHWASLRWSLCLSWRQGGLLASGRSDCEGKDDDSNGWSKTCEETKVSTQKKRKKDKNR